MEQLPLAISEQQQMAYEQLGTLAQLNWYPGHMAKAKKLIMENLKLVDLLVELRDARIPFSSENPVLKDLASHKPRIIVLNKMDLADPHNLKLWQNYYKERGIYCVCVDAMAHKGLKELTALAKNLTAKKLNKHADKGVHARNPRLMIIGIPNVGKSSLINSLAGSNSLKAANKPGVTRAKQWIKLKGNLDLLDTPGVLWPKFDDPLVGLHLAYTGAISDEVYDIELAASLLIWQLKDEYPQSLQERYKLTEFPPTKEELFELIGRKRGFLQKGGIIDSEKTAIAILKDFRSGKLGRISLEEPENISDY